jgi:hypothetical protein
MLFRLLAPTQSGIIPDKGRMGQARLENWRRSFSSRTVTRRDREITCGSPSDGLTPHWPDVSPNASIPSRGEDGRSPRVTARISLDSACLGLSIPSHCAASKPAWSPCRPVTVTLSPKCRQFGLMDALDALDAGCTGCWMHSNAFRCTWDHHPKVTGVLCIA